MKKTLCLLAISLVPLFVTAQSIPGDRSFNIPVPLLDLSGSHSSSDGLVDVALNVIHGASGAITGSGDAYYYDFDTGLELEAHGPLRGNVKNVRGSIQSSFTFSAPVTGENGFGDPESGSYRLTGKAVYPTGSDFVQVTANPRICLTSQHRCWNLPSGRFDFLSEATSWLLTFSDLAVTNRSVIGTARASIGQRRFFYTVRGSFNLRSTTYVLRLAGTGEGTGSSFSARCIVRDGELALTSLTGRLLGQAVKYKTP